MFAQMFSNIGTILAEISTDIIDSDWEGNIGGLITDVSPLINSSDWDVVANTATESAKAAITPALAIFTIIVGVPVAKKVFRKVSN